MIDEKDQHCNFILYVFISEEKHNFKFSNFFFCFKFLLTHSSLIDLMFGFFFLIHVGDVLGIENISVLIQFIEIGTYYKTRFLCSSYIFLKIIELSQSN